MWTSIARIHWRHGCPTLLGRAAQSSPEAAPRRAKGAGLYGEGADRATLQPPPLPPQIIVAPSPCADPFKLSFPQGFAWVHNSASREDENWLSTWYSWVDLNHRPPDPQSGAAPCSGTTSMNCSQGRAGRFSYPWRTPRVICCLGRVCCPSLERGDISYRRDG